MPTPRLLIHAALIGATLVATPLLALAQPDSPDDVRRKRALRQLRENARLTEHTRSETDELAPMDPELVAMYRDMLATVASPQMEGRIPGSRGIEKAADFIQHQIEALGLRPAFTDDEGNPTYRQPMQMGSRTTPVAVELSFGDASHSSFDEVSPLAFSASASVTAPVVFAGYAIVSGPDNYLGFETSETVEDKIAIILNFEPFNEDGHSRWRSKGWTHNARLTYKVSALSRRGAAGVIIVTPPGVDDPRAALLETVESTAPAFQAPGNRSGLQFDIPVVHATPAVVKELLDHLGADDDLEELTRLANQGGIVKPLGTETVSLSVDLERKPIMTDNIGAILPGRGPLADEFVVIGSHYDHVGYGKFGTRRQTDRGKLHPGADDNASGSVANLISAHLLKQRYQLLDEQDNARSILFLWFTAEESGLNGSRHYVQNPIAPLDKHLLMLNMDMVGTLSDGLLEIGGFDSGDGLKPLVTPALKTSAIPYSEDVSVGSGRSDHASFDRAGVPALFFFTGLHERYHAPEDTPEHIDNEGAVRIASLVSHIAFDAAIHTGDIPHPSEKKKPLARQTPKVRVGIIPSNTRQGGMRIERVFEDTAASDAGLRPGDRIIKWNDAEIDSVESWMPILADHQPGDKVTLTVQRGDQTLELHMTLRAIE